MGTAPLSTSWPLVLFYGWMGIEAFIRLKNFLCRHDALMLHYYLLLISPKVEISASRLVGIVAVGILLQYIYNELWWRDGIDCLTSKYYLQLHLILFRHAVRNVLRSYFCYFPRGGNDFRTHTFHPAAGLRSALSRVGGARARPYVKCCCSRRRRRQNSQFISSLGCKVQSGSTKLQIETAMPLQVVGFLRFH